MKVEKKVYILSETYKDNDPDDIGAYDSKQAMAVGFARRIASNVCEDMLSKDGKTKVRDVGYAVAEKVASLLPRLLDPEWDGTDECRDGRTVFCYREMDLESAHGEEVENG